MAVVEKTKEELEKLIDKAIKKIQGSKENDLCKYLPGPSGGYMHHFTMRKMKHQDPEQLFSLLKTFIVESDSPRVLNPKARAPRGSRKQYDTFNFSRADMEKILELARQTGDQDLIARFSPKRSFIALKKELIRSVRANQIHQDLWNAYVDFMSTLPKE